MAQNLGVLVDEEVPDSVIVGAARCRLGEHPAPSCFQSGEVRVKGQGMGTGTVGLPAGEKDWPARRSIGGKLEARVNKEERECSKVALAYLPNAVTPSSLHHSQSGNAGTWVSVSTAALVAGALHSPTSRSSDAALPPHSEYDRDHLKTFACEFANRRNSRSVANPSHVNAHPHADSASWYQTPSTDT